MQVPWPYRVKMMPEDFMRRIKYLAAQKDCLVTIRGVRRGQLRGSAANLQMCPSLLTITGSREFAAEVFNKIVHEVADCIGDGPLSGTDAESASDDPTAVVGDASGWARVSFRNQGKGIIEALVVAKKNPEAKEGSVTLMRLPRGRTSRPVGDDASRRRDREESPRRRDREEAREPGGHEHGVGAASDGARQGLREPKLSKGDESPLPLHTGAAPSRMARPSGAERRRRVAKKSRSPPRSRSPARPHSPRRPRRSVPRPKASAEPVVAASASVAPKLEPEPPVEDDFVPDWDGDEQEQMEGQVAELVELVRSSTLRAE